MRSSTQRGACLVEGVLDGHDGEVLAEGLVHLRHLRGGLLLRAVVVLRLEVEVVHLVLGVKLARGDVHADLDLALVPRLRDGLVDEIEALVVGGDVGREAALVAHVARVLAVLFLDERLEVVVHLAAHAHGLGEGGRAHGQDHELLHGEGVAGVGAAVDDVEGGNGELGLGVAGELGDVLPEGDALFGGAGLADGEGDGEDGVGAELALVLGAVELLDHVVVDVGLLDGVAALERGRDYGVDVVDRLAYALAHEDGLVAVAQLDRLVHARARARRHGRAEKALVRVHVRLHGGVAARVDDHAALDVRDFRARHVAQLVGHEGERVIRLLLDARIDELLDLLLQVVLVDVLLDSHGFDCARGVPQRKGETEGRAVRAQKMGLPANLCPSCSTLHAFVRVRLRVQRLTRASASGTPRPRESAV